MSVIGSVHSVESLGTLDGPGLRYVVFLQGCSLRCRYCHNPDTWNLKGGKSTDSRDLVKEILGYRNFIAKGGVTISGGEPLKQPEFALDVIERLKQEGLHTALDTAGSVPLELAKPVLDAADLILLDIKSLDDRMCFSLTGMGNANTLSTLAYCQSIGKGGGGGGGGGKAFSCIEQVELLPYHRMGQYKWEQLKLHYSFKDVPEPTKRELLMARSIFEEQGHRVLMTNLTDEKESKVG